MGPWGGEHQRCPEGGSVKQGALTLRPEYVKRGAPSLRTTERGEGGCCLCSSSSVRIWKSTSCHHEWQPSAHSKAASCFSKTQRTQAIQDHVGEKRPPQGQESLLRLLFALSPQRSQVGGKGVLVEPLQAPRNTL